MAAAMEEIDWNGLLLLLLALSFVHATNHYTGRGTVENLVTALQKSRRRKHHIRIVEQSASRRLNEIDELITERDELLAKLLTANARIKELETSRTTQLEGEGTGEHK